MMKFRIFYSFVSVLAIVSLSCNFLTQSLPESPGTSVFSAEATSPVSVRLEWRAVSGASAYKLEGRYGTDFFSIADLPGDQTGYEHFVVPGSAEITYRLSADGKEIGTRAVRLPELTPDPVVARFDEVTATSTGFAFPTLDPNNPDPGSFDPSKLLPPGFDPNDPGSFDPSSMIKPVSVTQQVGPEGGSVTMTSPAGVTFTLDVPAGALRDTVPLTLTPVESQSQSPLPFSGGLLAAVQIRPVIPFELMLTLHVQLAPDSPAAAAPLVVGFDASGMSDELALYPIEADGENAYRMKIDWGDTFGLAAATPPEVRDQALKIPSDGGARMAQQIAVLRALSPDPGDATDAMILNQLLEGLLQQVNRIVVRQPDNSRAGSGPFPISRLGSSEQQKSAAASQLAQSIYYTEDMFNRFSDLGIQTQPKSRALLTRLAEMIKRMVKIVQQACLSEDALFIQLILKRLGAGAQMPHLRGTFWGDMADVYGPVEELRPCRITLEIKSATIVVKEGDGSYYKMVASSPPITLELVYEGDRLRLRGAGPVQYSEYELFAAFCPPAKKLSVFPSPVLWITNLQPLFDPNDGRLIDFALHRVMPDPIASRTSGSGRSDTPSSGKCRLVELNVTEPTDFWSLGFTGLHNANPTQNWSIESQESGLTATKSVSLGQGGLTEDSTLVITVSPSE